MTLNFGRMPPYLRSPGQEEETSGERSAVPVGSKVPVTPREVVVLIAVTFGVLGKGEYQPPKEEEPKGFAPVVNA
jgi:hypothetical protein